MTACPVEPTPDAAVPFDAGVTPISCDGPAACAAHGAVCRAGACEADVPCGDDVECALGERCVGGQCRFRGCTGNADCASGFCDLTTYACAECGSSSQCPAERPVCDVGTRKCVLCASTSQCPPPGQPHCSPNGACVACLTDAHCPSGLVCSSGHLCVGVSENAPCPAGTACAAGLVCVNVNASPVCLKSCALYEPDCVSGQICYGLTYSSSTSLVFEADGPIGVCFSPQAGQRGLREPCVRTPTGSNCQPNLTCMPESATLALCRAYCDPLASGTCAVGEVCTRFVGDFSGREYGVCLADTGFGARCDADGTCRTGLSCQPFDVPSEFDLVAGVCQFSLGDGGVGAPCAPQVLADGGSVVAERACRSAKCVNDPLVVSPATAPYFCFSGCASDADCGDEGVCDADFMLSTAYGTTAAMRGCRPTCRDEEDCGRYDAGVTCRARVIASTTASTFTTTCSPPAGGGGPGASCALNSDCRSNFCQLDDSRGVRRPGVCAVFCDGDAGCGEDTCVPTVHLLSRGPDGVAMTADDQVATRAVCGRGACLLDEECGDGGVCSLQRDPASPAARKRCARATTGVKRGGESCASDGECHSGVCGTLGPPSTFSGRACFEACTPSSACPGATQCRALAFSVPTPGGSTVVDSCAP